jgi:hypothetical protein
VVEVGGILCHLLWIRGDRRDTPGGGTDDARVQRQIPGCEELPDTGRIDLATISPGQLRCERCSQFRDSTASAESWRERASRFRDSNTSAGAESWRQRASRFRDSNTSAGTGSWSDHGLQSGSGISSVDCAKICQ